MGDSTRIPAMVAGAILIVFGLISIFVLSRMNEQKIARCTEDTKAVVTKVKTKGSAEDKSLRYETDLEYTVDEQVYTLHYSLNTDLGEGSKVKMKYNPKDASEYYIASIDKRGDNSRVIGVISAGAGLAVIAIAGGVISTRTYG
ncbi:MAG: DUF3592 domain-containing protein [Lachnospiraceae bacterium]|nr:DUF3592 domain-containing protein [Lachnospiraceae bacterium]